MIINLKSIDVDLTPEVSEYSETSPEIDQTYDWDPIPGDAKFDLIDGDIRIPGVVSKESDTPFRMSILETGEYLSEVEVTINITDYTESEWVVKFGEDYSLVGKFDVMGTQIPVNIPHPKLGNLDAVVSLEEDESGYLRVVVVSVEGMRAYLPIESVVYEEGLTKYGLVKLSRGDWKPDPSEVVRVQEECQAWNHVEWVVLHGSYSEVYLHDGDDDTRKDFSTKHTGVWYQDPTGRFRGKDSHSESPWGVFFHNRPGHRDPEKEIDSLFPISNWIERWQSTILSQW